MTKNLLGSKRNPIILHFIQSVFVVLSRTSLIKPARLSRIYHGATKDKEEIKSKAHIKESKHSEHATEKESPATA